MLQPAQRLRFDLTGAPPVMPSGYSSPRITRGGAGSSPNLKQCFEITPRQIAVAQYAGQKAWSDDFRAMDRDRGHAAVCMAQAMMAALGANNDEAGLLQNGDDLASGEARQSAHAETVTR
jgi:hypothetical protein